MAKFNRLNIDIETFCSVDIGKCGAYKYAASPDLEILLFAYSVDGAPVQLVDLASGEKLPADIVAALNDPDVVKWAYNAQFEYLCLRRFYRTDVRQWRCTMVRGAAAGYPMGLARIAKAIGLPQDKQKDGRGSALIKMFSIPQKESARILPSDKPAEWQEFREYCIQDVVTESAVLDNLAGLDLPAHEWGQWALNIEINDRGVPVNRQMVENAIRIWDVRRQEIFEDAVELTGLQNPNSRDQLKRWIEGELDEALPNARKETLQDVAARTDAPENVIEAVNARIQLGKTSIAKYVAMQRAVMDDGRVRGTLMFYGAGTGRFSGKIIQPQNMPRDHFEDEATEREFLRVSTPAAFILRHEDTAYALSKLIRNVIEAAPGHRFIVSDFSAIECRVLAALAGERWVLDTFIQGGDIYKAQASRMFGIPVEEVDKDGRQRGKAAILGGGFGGGVGAYIKTGAVRMGIPEDKLPGLVKQYRQSNPQIVKFWYDYMNRLIHVVKTGQRMRFNGLQIALRNGSLCVTLPSGRDLVYPEPSITENRFGRETFQHKTWAQDRGGWINRQMWHGIAVENVVQAIARDCMTDALRRLETLGYRAILHVHDEIVCEMPDGVGSVEEMNEVLGAPIPWFPNLPLAGAGYESLFYLKD